MSWLLHLVSNEHHIGIGTPLSAGSHDTAPLEDAGWSVKLITAVRQGDGYGGYIVVFERPV